MTILKLSTPQTKAELREAFLASFDDMSFDLLSNVYEFMTFLQYQTSRHYAADPKDDLVSAASISSPPIASHRRLHYPTISVPASTLEKWVGVLPALGGDALLDTEALYDGD